MPEEITVRLSPTRHVDRRPAAVLDVEGPEIIVPQNTTYRVKTARVRGLASLEQQNVDLETRRFLFGLEAMCQSCYKLSFR